MDTYWLLDKSYNASKSTDEYSDSRIPGQTVPYPEVTPTHGHMHDDVGTGHHSPNKSKDKVKQGKDEHNLQKGIFGTSTIKEWNEEDIFGQ